MRANKIIKLTGTLDTFYKATENKILLKLDGDNGYSSLYVNEKSNVHFGADAVNNYGTVEVEYFTSNKMKVVLTVKTNKGIVIADMDQVKKLHSNSYYNSLNNTYDTLTEDEEREMMYEKWKVDNRERYHNHVVQQQYYIPANVEEYLV